MNTEKAIITIKNIDKSGNVTKETETEVSSFVLSGISPGTEQDDSINTVNMFSVHSDVNVEEIVTLISTTSKNCGMGLRKIRDIFTNNEGEDKNDVNEEMKKRLAMDSIEFNAYKRFVVEFLKGLDLTEKDVMATESSESAKETVDNLTGDGGGVTRTVK